MTAGRRGCFPGSFDPLTIAHVEIAAAARSQCDLTAVDLVLSRVALGKAGHHHDIEERVAIIETVSADLDWLHVVVTDAQFLADIAAGYDVLILGADKWAQVIDPAFYASPRHRDDAVARLPAVACAPRPGFDIPEGVTALRLEPWVGAVSSTAVRAGATHWRAGGIEGETRQSPE